VTLDQLRVFVAVAERQHMTRAAQNLNLAQSAVSAAVAALEAQYEIKLFDRAGRGIVLTDAGHAFLVEARAVLARAEAAALMLAALGGRKKGRLRVQASQTIASHWLPRHLAAFRQIYPDIEIRLGIGNTAEVAAAVRDGAAELGFVEGAVEDPALVFAAVARDQLELVVSPRHGWAALSDLPPARLAETEWVMREPGSGTRSAFETAWAGFGLSPTALRIALELPSNEAVRAAVEAGAGAAVLSASVVAPSLEAGLLHRLKLDLPSRQYRVLRHRERYQTPAAEALLRLVGVGAG
jgi:DNA-binding transcriptional LysR family regulator